MRHRLVNFGLVQEFENISVYEGKKGATSQAQTKKGQRSHTKDQGKQEGREECDPTRADLDSSGLDGSEKSQPENEFADHRLSPAYIRIPLPPLGGTHLSSHSLQMRPLRVLHL